MHKYLYSTGRTLMFPYLNVVLKDFKHLRAVNPIKLNQEEVHYLQEVHQLTSWQIASDLSKLTRTIKFNNFQEAFSFMNSIAVVAEETNHHPEWTNVYNQVKVVLNTHETDGISVKDFFVAHAIDLVGLEVQFKSAQGTHDLRHLDVIKILETWNQNYIKHQNYVSTLQSKAQQV